MSHDAEGMAEVLSRSLTILRELFDTGEEYHDCQWDAAEYAIEAETALVNALIALGRDSYGRPWRAQASLLPVEAVQPGMMLQTEGEG